jgi:type IV pilus assembly protein PilV
MKQSTHRSFRPSTGNGFSMIEVLIALVVLSVGLLGLAALQAEGLRGSSSALQRTGAVAYASDIADRMRANRMGLASYEVTFANKVAAGKDHKCAAGHDSENVIIAAQTCDPKQMAEYDLFRWKDEMDDRNYSGQIASEGLDNTQFTLTVSWKDRTLANSNEQFYSALVQF